METNNHEEFTNESLYAYELDNKVIFIGDVLEDDKGLGPGYFCLGCKKQMQAVLPKTKVSKYFRHHVAKSSPENRCTYSQESHRHLLSKTFLKDLNRIKVPSLYKYPDSDDDPIYQIREADFVKAHSVVLEKAIFEDKNGEVQLISKDQIDKKHLYLIPDAILLNEKNEPILLVEFVATNKPDQEKLMKLKRLGIDAVQVYVPKSFPEEIKRNLLISKNTKWLFSNEEQNTPYVQISKEDPRRVYDVDELQRSLFEEGYKCRSAQLGELIRSIERILGSESYRTIEQDIESEIRRVTEASERAESELAGLRDQHGRSGIERHQKRRNSIEESESAFYSKTSNLERRYHEKRYRVEEEIRAIEEQTERVRADIRAFEYKSNPEKSIRAEQDIQRRLKDELEDLSWKQNELQQSFERDKGKLQIEDEREQQSIRREFEISSTREQQIKNDLQQKLSSIPDDHERELQKSIRSFDSAREGIKRRIAGTREKRNTIGEILRREQNKIESELSVKIERTERTNDKIRKDRLQKLYNGDFEGALLNKNAYERIPKLKKLIKLYSNRLEILNRIDQKNQ